MTHEKQCNIVKRIISLLLCLILLLGATAIPIIISNAQKNTVHA